MSVQAGEDGFIIHPVSVPSDSSVPEDVTGWFDEALDPLRLKDEVWEALEQWQDNVEEQERRRNKRLERPEKRLAQGTTPKSAFLSLGAALQAQEDNWHASRGYRSDMKLGLGLYRLEEGRLTRGGGWDVAKDVYVFFGHAKWPDKEGDFTGIGDRAGKVLDARLIERSYTKALQAFCCCAGFYVVEQTVAEDNGLVRCGPRTKSGSGNPGDLTWKQLNSRTEAAQIGCAAFFHALSDRVTPISTAQNFATSAMLTFERIDPQTWKLSQDKALQRYGFPEDTFYCWQRRPGAGEKHYKLMNIVDLIKAGRRRLRR